MGMQTTAGTNALKIILQAVTWASVAINATSSPYTNLYLSLHTADPGASGNQTTSEAGYTSYARVAVARTTGGWSVTSAVATLVATMSFPACTGSTSTCTYFGLGTDSTGNGNLLISGAISPTIAVATGVTPQLTTATSITVA